jgi:hypothetical protein
VLITAGGDVFSANGDSWDTDILYQQSLAVYGFWDLFWSPRLNEFAAIDDASVRIFDMTTYAELHQFGLAGTGRFVGRRGPLVYAMQVDGGETRLEVLAYGNRAPVAGIAAIPTVECEGPDGAQVRLDGSTSFDEDSIDGVFEDIVSYEWFLEDADSGNWVSLGQGESLDVKLPLGSHEIQLRIADHAGETSTAVASVDVADSTAPELSLTADPSMLAKLNRKMVKVQIGVVAWDTCGSVGVALTDATSNAESLPAPRKPSFLADIQDAEIGTDDRAVWLRAEHNPAGPHRVYTLTYSAIDESGNETVATVEIPVIEPGSLSNRRQRR